MQTRLFGPLLLATVAWTGGGLAQQPRVPARLERALPWAASGVWLKAETHVHSRFSDGAQTIDELVDRAQATGCDVLAITDHTDRKLHAATPEYHAAIGAARQRVPHLILITGLEWNVPPGRGHDHAAILLPPEMDDAALTGEFKAQFDDEGKQTEGPELATAAFAWLQRKASNLPVGPVVFLNHPSRRAPDLETVRRQIDWLSTIGGGIFAGAEGAPGHQHATPLGAYERTLQPVDRWDPAVAPPGAVWDQILAGGRTVSGALASADFHSVRNGDYWPGEFSATWIYAPDRTARGALQALAAGSFFGVHGDIARRVQLRVGASGLPRPAIPGESLRVAPGETVTLELRADVPATDWQGSPNRVDVAEIFATTASGTRLVASGPLDRGTLRSQFVVPSGGVALRARGRRKDPGGDLLFYTNAVQIR